VDRAALDVALKHGINAGGWCPTERTLQNVKDSDGTVIIYPGKLSGGTEQTVHFCVEQQRPHELIDSSNVSTEKAAQLIADFVRTNKIDVLNVAGPRQSEWAKGYDYTMSIFEAFVNSIASTSGSKRRSYS